LSARIWVAPES